MFALQIFVYDIAIMDGPLCYFASLSIVVKYTYLNLEDIAFSSHTDGGKLKYTTSSLMQLHGKQFDDFNQFDSITYDLSLIQFDEMT